MYCTLVFWHFTLLFFRFNIQFNLTNNLTFLHFPVQIFIEFNFPVRTYLNKLKQSKTFSTEMKKLCEFNFCEIFIFVDLFGIGVIVLKIFEIYSFTRKRNLDLFSISYSKCSFNWKEQYVENSDCILFHSQKSSEKIFMASHFTVKILILTI